jgi:hypothetical protein
VVGLAVRELTLPTPKAGLNITVFGMGTAATANLPLASICAVISGRYFYRAVASGSISELCSYFIGANRKRTHPTCLAENLWRFFRKRGGIIVNQLVTQMSDSIPWGGASLYANKNEIKLK